MVHSRRCRAIAPGRARIRSPSPSALLWTRRLCGRWGRGRQPMCELPTHCTGRLRGWEKRQHTATVGTAEAWSGCVQLALMFAVKNFRARDRLVASRYGQAGGAQGRRQGQRRRLASSSFAGWLPHDRRFVSGLPPTRWRASAEPGRLIARHEGSPPCPAPCPGRRLAVTFRRRPSRDAPVGRLPKGSRPFPWQWRS
jgi:hypothetical protein